MIELFGQMFGLVLLILWERKPLEGEGVDLDDEG